MGKRWHEVREDTHNALKILNVDYIESDYYIALFYARCVASNMRTLIILSHPTYLQFDDWLER